MINVNYIGYDGFQNYGDDVNKEIVMKLGFQHDENSDIVFIGPGTGFPIPKSKQQLIKENTKEVIVFGTGCHTKKFYKDENSFEEDMKFTKELLKKAKYIGVRDSYTQKTIGCGKVIGDPFFLLSIPKKEEIPEKYVILIIGRAGFNCWGEVDGEFNSLKNTIKFTKNFIMKKLGFKVKIFYLFNNDAPLSYEISSYLNESVFKRIEMYENFLTEYRNAEFIISYKLHGMITALLTNTPIIPIEYVPKITNVASDFKIDNLVLKSNEVTEKQLENKYNLLKNWDYTFIKNKRQKYINLQYKFIEQIKKIYGENNENNING